MTRVLIVGGTSGIGEAVVHELKHDATLSEMELVVPAVYKGDEGHLVFELDVQYTKNIEHYIQENGPFTHIVYTAGVNKLVPGEMLDNGKFAEAFAVNTFGFATLVGYHQARFPGALRSAVAVSSDAARTPMRNSAIYCSSKAALNQIVRVLAREWVKDGVRINAVAPASVDGTPMARSVDNAVQGLRGWTEEEARAYELQKLPAGRRANVQEVAQVIVTTLFGPEYQTGSIIDITGGL